MLSNKFWKISRGSFRKYSMHKAQFGIKMSHCAVLQRVWSFTRQAVQIDLSSPIRYKALTFAQSKSIYVRIDSHARQTKADEALHLHANTLTILKGASIRQPLPQWSLPHEGKAKQSSTPGWANALSSLLIRHRVSNTGILMQREWHSYVLWGAILARKIGCTDDSILSRASIGPSRDMETKLFDAWGNPQISYGTSYVSFLLPAWDSPPEQKTTCWIEDTLGIQPRRLDTTFNAVVSIMPYFCFSSGLAKLAQTRFAIRSKCNHIMMNVSMGRMKAVVCLYTVMKSDNSSKHVYIMIVYKSSLSSSIEYSWKEQSLPLEWCQLLDQIRRPLDIIMRKYYRWSTWAYCCTEIKEWRNESSDLHIPYHE